MLYGMQSRPLDPRLFFSKETNARCNVRGFSPLVAYSIFWIESIGEYGLKAATCLQDGADYATGKMPDGSNAGHGIGQLTSSWPLNWSDASTNIDYAIERFMVPALHNWHTMATGDDLVRCIAADYNAGYGGAMAGHKEGDVGKYTTAHYPDRALRVYQALCATNLPPSTPLSHFTQGK